MTARTHDAFAFASLVTAAVYFPPENLNLYTLLGAVIGSNIGALVPDLDDAGNRLWDFLPIGDMAGKVFRKIFYKHRTVSHSLLGLFLFYKFLEWLLPRVLNPNFINPQIILISVMIGYISHLASDLITKEGLPLLFPLRMNFGIPPISSLRVTTGSWVEKFVVLPSVTAYLIWFISINREKLVEIISKVGS